ncbi:MAG: hypothetical protein ACE5GI_05900, partial [Candidatus Aminicenantales bacterium]
MKGKALFIAIILFLGWFIFFFPPFLKAQGKKGNVIYEIWVELDDQHKMLYGQEDIIWFNQTQDEVHDMWFHLYFNAFKNEKSAMIEEAKEESIRALGLKIGQGEWGWIDITAIRLADGRDLKPTLKYVTQDKPLHPGDQTVARVLFPEGIKPGQ